MNTNKQIILRDKIAQAGGYKDHADAVEQIKMGSCNMPRLKKNKKPNGGVNMKHWHWSRPSNRAVSHKHEGGNKLHVHFNKGWIGYGRTKKSLMKLANKDGKL